MGGTPDAFVSGMRTTPESSMLALSQDLLDPSFGRVALARRLVHIQAAHAVVIADLGYVPGQGVVSRSLIVQARTTETMSQLLRGFAAGPLPDFSRPDAKKLEGFHSAQPEALPFAKQTPNILGPELRYLHADTLKVKTYLGIFGSPGTLNLSRRWKALLNDVLPAIGPFLERTQSPASPINGAFAVDQRGQLIAADRDSEQWFASNVRTTSLSVLMRLAPASEEINGPLDGARITLRAARAMNAGESPPTWLGTVFSPQSLYKASDAILTPTQREVASQAATGATSGEIARSLGVRVETVRTHIRDIYARLGISTRAELASRWATDAQTSPSLAA